MRPRALLALAARETAVHEAFPCGAWHEAAFARQRLRRHLMIIAVVALVLLAAAIALSLK